MADAPGTPEHEGPTTEATTVDATRRDSTAPDWARKYPPLLTVAVALLIALTVLPSALNLPQSNPQETLEYAPVPPEDENDSPPEGNLSALGLGSSSGIEGGGADGGLGGAPPPPARGGAISGNVRCSANNQQTLDPLSPPCVPFFEGENYGKTYKGVTGEEVRLVIYIDGGINYTGGSDADNRVSPSGELYDLFKTPAENMTANGRNENNQEHLTTKGMRVWQAYFNQRFQTYKRRVHFFVYYSSDIKRGQPEGRRADAATILEKVDPFAVLSFASEGAEDDFLEAMARKGVLNFGSFGLRPAAFFNSYPKLIWSYSPSIEQQAESYASYVCQKVAPHPSVLAGPVLNNQHRKYGMIHTINKNQKPFIALAGLLKDKLKAECNITIEHTSTFDNICLAQDNGDEPDTETTDMATFQQKGITTILWPGCISGNYAKTAAGSGYQPEWILMGDGLMDGNYTITIAQAQAAFDGRAIIVTPQVVEPALAQQRCFQAFREIDKKTPNSDVSYVCDDYKNIFQFFVGVQVAGPKLTPTNVDKGFHAIPQRQSGEPTVPACFYLPGDYTCIKDAQAEIYSASSTPPGSSQPGCWKSIEFGKRYLPKTWPSGNINAQIRGNEPCNGYSTSVRFNLA